MENYVRVKKKKSRDLCTNYIIKGKSKFRIICMRWSYFCEEHKTKAHVSTDI